MIANYGYEDGSGFYYITIDGDVCARCSDHGCMNACPQGVYVIEMDDYDDLVAVVAEAARKRLRELCSVCKGPERRRAGPSIGCPAPPPARAAPCVIAGRPAWNSGSTASLSPCPRARPCSRPATWPAGTFLVCARIPGSDAPAITRPSGRPVRSLEPERLRRNAACVW